MRKVILLLYLFAITESFAQQPETLRCATIDSVNFLPVQHSKLFVVLQKDTLFSYATIDGQFSISCHELSKPGTRLLIVSDGYQEKIIPVDPSICSTDSVYLIRLSTRARTLENINVPARSPLIKQDLDKITYNVQQDPESKFLSLLDLMRKLPFVSLSADDNPMLKGNSNFLVLLDGRRSSLFSTNNLREALRAIPASGIVRVEIITDPPPRFESEGFAGVINIVTLKRLHDGYNGSLNLSVASFISGGSSSLNIRRQRFGFTFFGGVNFERTALNAVHSETTNSLFTIRQNGQNRIKSAPKYANMLFSYEIDSLSLVTLNLGGNATSSTNLNITEASTQYKNGGNPSLYAFRFNQDNTGTGWDANLNYQKNFRKNKSRILTASYRFNHNSGQSEVTNVLTRKENFDGLNYEQDSKEGLRENAIQLDYVHPTRKVQIETGAKYIHRDIFSHYTSTAYDPATGSSQLDSTNTDDLGYDLSVLGIYNSYLLKLKVLSLRGGFRYERTRLDGRFNTAAIAISQQYDHLLPSFKVQYQSKKNTALSLAFSQRIQRPGISLLSPLVIKTAPGFARTGNPDLRPVLANHISFGFSRFGKASVASSLNYSFSRNTIQSFSNTVEADSVLLTSFQNIGRYDRFGMDINTRFPISANIDFTIDGSLNRVVVRTNSSSNRGIEGFIYSYLNYKGKKGWRYSANAGFYGPTINIQATSNSYFYSSLSVSRQIMKNNGTVSFRVANPFQQYRSIQTKINTTDLVQVINRENLFRAFYLSLFFKFGKLDKEVKRNRRSIQIDDAASETGKVQELP